MLQLYDRQKQLELKIPPMATVVGCGGTGTWTALFLAMSGVPNLILIDSDRLELTNLNRLPYPEIKTGCSKAQALKDLIKSLRPLCRIEVHERTVETEDDCDIMRGHVFCCIDGKIQMHRMINAYCHKNSLPYQRIGYDGTVLNVSTAFPHSVSEDPETEEQTGYTIDPSWVVPAATAAALGVYAQLRAGIMYMDDMSYLSSVHSAVPQQAKRDSEIHIRGLLRKYQRDIRRFSYGYCDKCQRVGCDDCNKCETCNRCDDCDKSDCEGCDRLEQDWVKTGIDAFGPLDSSIVDSDLPLTISNALLRYYRRRKLYEEQHPQA